MIHIIPKWMVIFSFEKTLPVKMYIHDDFYSGVLRKAAEISFDYDNPVTGIHIDLIQSLTPTVTSISNE